MIHRRLSDNCDVFGNPKIPSRFLQTVISYNLVRDKDVRVYVLPYSSGSIVSDYRLDDRSIGVRFPAGAKNFSSSLCPDRLWGPPSLLYNGYRGVLSPGVRARPGRDADHSPPSSAEVVNE
jgi:hypothetical protein